MVDSSGDDVPTQLAALLGRATVRIRKTDETPPRISAIDVAQAMTGKDARHAAQEVRTLCSRYPEVEQMLVHLKKTCVLLTAIFSRKGGERQGPTLEFRGEAPSPAASAG